MRVDDRISEPVIGAGLVSVDNRLAELGVGKLLGYEREGMVGAVSVCELEVPELSGAENDKPTEPGCGLGGTPGIGLYDDGAGRELEVPGSMEPVAPE